MHKPTPCYIPRTSHTALYGKSCLLPSDGVIVEVASLLGLENGVFGGIE